jgi:hypothetical protein
MNRKEFTNLLLEWRKNFINESSQKDLASIERFFEYAKEKLPYIATRLGATSFEYEPHLGLNCIDGNHRLEIFKRISLNLPKDKQNIPAIVSIPNDKEYKDHFLDHYRQDQFKKLSNEDKGKIDNTTIDFLQKDKDANCELVLVKNLKISDITSGENSPTPKVNEYITKLYESFISENKDLDFDKDFLESIVPSIKIDAEDDDDTSFFIP